MRKGNECILFVSGRLLNTVTDMTQSGYPILSFDSAYAPAKAVHTAMPQYSVNKGTYYVGDLYIKPDGTVIIGYCPVASETWGWCSVSWFINE